GGEGARDLAPRRHVCRAPADHVASGGRLDGPAGVVRDSEPALRELRIEDADRVEWPLHPRLHRPDLVLVRRVSGDVARLPGRVARGGIERTPRVLPVLDAVGF